MTNLPAGFKYYLLILTPSLIDDLEDYGLHEALHEPGLDHHEVEKTFFLARATKAWLPVTPEAADPDLWPDLMSAIHRIRKLLDVLEKEVFEAVIANAKETTSEIARANLTREFEEKRSEGELDFRLHGLSTSAPPPDATAPDPAVAESFRLKRTQRYQALIGYDGESLKPGEKLILADAKASARAVMEDGEQDVPIDAVLAMAAVLMETAGVQDKSQVPEEIREKFRRMTGKAAMALGAIIYRHAYREYKKQLGLEPLTSDL
ncbi:hypothetical protein [Marinobacter salicampi]|uniref:hypothetical protein n=1 Tax=Marinobacter salicampi TaxID=435907 RepID=UPI001408F929|nr:hypothetical protein [Marinobacter salicampi]